MKKPPKVSLLQRAVTVLQNRFKSMPVLNRFQPKGTAPASPGSSIPVYQSCALQPP